MAIRQAGDPNFLRIQIETKVEMARVVKAVEKTAFRSFAHAAASIAKDAKASLEKAPEGEPSEPGKPPHTHKGAYLRRAIRFASDKEGAVIGPMASVVGEELGPTHELGAPRGGVDFPERPFMVPALERAIPRFAGEWKGALGG